MSTSGRGRGIGAVLDGAAIARDIRARLAADAAQLAGAGRPPTLGLLSASNDPGAGSYGRAVQRVADATGVQLRGATLGPEASLGALGDVVHEWARDQHVHGIAVVAPLPAAVDHAELGAGIPPAKDVDGINPESAGRLLLGLAAHAPATALAVLELLRTTGRPLAGAHAVVIGRSPVVGKPVALLLLAAHATVTVCHSRTVDLAAHTRTADVLVAAAGRPRLITDRHVRPGAVVIDVGTNVVDGTVVGDVDFDAVVRVAGAISPVPGGVGPLTTTMLMANTIAAASAAEHTFRSGHA